jgi:hypothetical protein
MPRAPPSLWSRSPTASSAPDSAGLKTSHSKPRVFFFPCGLFPPCSTRIPLRPAKLGSPDPVPLRQKRTSWSKEGRVFRLAAFFPAHLTLDAETVQRRNWLRIGVTQMLLFNDQCHEEGSESCGYTAKPLRISCITGQARLSRGPDRGVTVLDYCQHLFLFLIFSFFCFFHQHLDRELYRGDGTHVVYPVTAPPGMIRQPQLPS